MYVWWQREIIRNILFNLPYPGDGLHAILYVCDQRSARWHSSDNFRKVIEKTYEITFKYKFIITNETLLINQLSVNHETNR